jgi:hypothetical protein
MCGLGFLGLVLWVFVIGGWFVVAYICLRNLLFAKRGDRG